MAFSHLVLFNYTLFKKKKNASKKNHLVVHSDYVLRKDALKKKCT